MYPVFISVHPQAALCLGVCSQPHTFSCVQISPSPAPHPLPACSRPCLLVAGRQEAGSSRGLSATFLPGRKLPPPSVLHTVRQQNLCSWAGFSPDCWLGDTLSCVIRLGKVSHCSPNTSLCFTLMGEREEGRNSCSVLFEKGCLQRRQERVTYCTSQSGQDWRYWARKAHTKSSMENLALNVFWIDTGFRDLENKSCWHVGAVESLSKYPE